MNRMFVTALLLGAMAVPVLAQAPAGAPAAATAPAGGRGGRGPQGPAPTGPAGIAPSVMLTADKEIPFDQALDAAKTAMDACLAIKSAAVVAVVDLNGNYKVLLRPDGTGLPFYDYMRRKAYTVLKKSMPSGDFGKLPEVASLPRNAVIEGDANLITFPGALPIMKNGAMVGVLSVSGPTGGDNDMKCTTAGMAKFHL